jgi:hypothetical protein
VLPNPPTPHRLVTERIEAPLAELSADARQLAVSIIEIFVGAEVGRARKPTPPPTAPPDGEPRADDAAD